jgi:hypothetical protein
MVTTAVTLALAGLTVAIAAVVGTLAFLDARPRRSDPRATKKAAEQLAQLAAGTSESSDEATPDRIREALGGLTLDAYVERRPTSPFQATSSASTSEARPAKPDEPRLQVNEALLELAKKRMSSLGSKPTGEPSEVSERELAEARQRLRKAFERKGLDPDRIKAALVESEVPPHLRLGDVIL